MIYILLLCSAWTESFETQGFFPPNDWLVANEDALDALWYTSCNVIFYLTADILYFEYILDSPGRISQWLQWHISLCCIAYTPSAYSTTGIY
jgi:hypothetical protein